MDERGHLRERPLGNRRGEILQKTFALALEDRDLDLAAGLTILPDELVEIRAGVRLLVAARDAQHGGRGRPLATGQDARGRSLGHDLFRLPVLVVHGHHAVGQPGGRGAILSQTLRVVIAPERIDHGRHHDHAAQGAIDHRGARRE
jgi:hypothetical protein